MSLFNNKNTTFTLDNLSCYFNILITLNISKINVKFPIFYVLVCAI